MKNQKQKRSDNQSKFLETLYEILDNKDQSIIFWCENGFVIQHVDQFKNEILPKYFTHNHYSSLLRQLNKYGFQLKSKGQDTYIFTHQTICENKRQLKKQKKMINNEQNLDMYDEIIEMRIQILNVQQQQSIFKKQMGISIQIMRKLMMSYDQLSKTLMQSIGQANNFSSVIFSNFSKALQHVSGDLLLHQITSAKIAFPEFFDSTFATPCASLLGTPIPFYISMIKELVSIKDSINK